MVYIIIGIMVITIVSFIWWNWISYKGWKLIYLSYGYQDYFKIIGKLKAANIRYKVKIPFGGFGVRTEQFNNITLYEIYVREEDEHFENKSIHTEI